MAEIIKKVLVTENGEFFYLKELKDFHTQYGYVGSADLKSRKDCVITNKGKKLFMFEPSAADLLRKIKRHAQIITPKDIGAIIANTGMNKSSSVIELGSGSGALTCMLGLVAKKVVSYDIDERSIKTTQENIKMIGLKNVSVKNKDAYGKLDERDADILTLDLPEPWKALENANKALKQGGFLVSYSPQITQALEFSNEARQKGFIVLKTIELIEREWQLEGKKARPDFRGLGHTGFLTFARKIG